MKRKVSDSVVFSTRNVSVVVLSMAICLGISTSTNADEADARRLLKAMSDYMAAQKEFSFDYDATLQVVTAEDQVLGLASSGSVVMNRPNKVHATRKGGFADVDMSFDGSTLTILGKNINKYAQIAAPGSVDQLVDILRDQYGRPLPAADLMLSNAYDALMENVVDVKDLGSGVIGGMECDSLAFRKADVDFQIWIAHGDHPYPCRYVITSSEVAGNPQYSIQVSNWKTGVEATKSDFVFKNPSNAEKVELEDLKGAGDLPSNFTMGESQ
jgi:hypothetical protein